MKDLKGFRSDAFSKVTGRARYADDIVLPKMLHAVPVYTEYVHAEIKVIDTEEAEAMPGVVRVLTWKDIPGELYFGQIEKDLPLFASDKVRSYGDVIALVAAETRQEALAAAEKVKFGGMELPGVFDPEEATREEAPLLFEERKTNIVNHHKTRRGDPDTAMENAGTVIRQTFATGFFEHAYLEPEGAVCEPRPDGVLEVHGSIQHPVSTRRFIAAYLGLRLADVEIISHPTGGSFGGKDDTASLVAARAALAARLTDRPVKLIYNREWSMRESYKRPAYKLDYTMGLSDNGKIEAVICRNLADSGAYTSTVPWSTWRAAVQCCGPYQVEHVRGDTYGVATNNIFTGAFRGFGSPQVNFSIEQLMDMAAETRGLTPREIRRKNMVTQDCTTITGQVLDNHTVSLGEVMDRVLDTIGYDEKFQRCSRGTGDPSNLYGIGFAVSYRGASLGAEGKDFCSAVVNCQFDGSVLLETGIWENGQGARGTMMLALSEALGISLERIRYGESSTSRIPDSGTTVASRGTLLGTGAVYKAAENLKELVSDTLATELGCEPWEVSFHDNAVWGGGERLGWEEAMGRMYEARVFPYAFGNFQTPDIWWDDEKGCGVPYFTYVYSCQAVEVRVDETRKELRVENIVAGHDIGKAVNPLYLHGQIYGGLLQGAGMALTEDFRIEKGRVKSLNYNGYSIPTAVDFPDIGAIIIENDDPTSPMGCKGIGEPALEITAPAIANALYQATGKRQFTLPLRGYKLKPRKGPNDGT